MSTTSGTSATSETIQATRLYDELSRILDQLLSNPDYVVQVTRNGRRAAVIISPPAWDATQGDHR